MNEGYYSIKLIEWLLSNYAYLEEGKLPEDSEDMPQVTQGNTATFERALVYKVDLDNAIQQLSHTYQLLVILVYREGRDLWDAGNQMRLGIDVDKVLNNAIHEMWRVMNGKPVKHRPRTYCKSN